MSEELLQTVPVWIGRYAYYKVGNSTLSQLKRNKIININEASLKDKRPDGLIVLPGGVVKAVIEYKTSKELSSKLQVRKAIEQELEVAKLLCKILIVTDGKKSFWINAVNGALITKGGKPISVVFDAERITANKLTIEEKRLFETIGLISVIFPKTKDLTALIDRIYEIQPLELTPSGPIPKDLSELRNWRDEAIKELSVNLKEKYLQPIDDLLNYLNEHLESDALDEASKKPQN